ncbi:hypothetical protein [Lysobacter gummosus]
MRRSGSAWTWSKSIGAQAPSYKDFAQTKTPGRSRVFSLRD